MHPLRLRSTERASVVYFLYSYGHIMTNVEFGRLYQVVFKGNTSICLVYQTPTIQHMLLYIMRI